MPSSRGLSRPGRCSVRQQGCRGAAASGSEASILRSSGQSKHFRGSLLTVAAEALSLPPAHTHTHTQCTHVHTQCTHACTHIHTCAHTHTVHTRAHGEHTHALSRHQAAIPAVSDRAPRWEQRPSSSHRLLLRHREGHLREKGLCVCPKCPTALVSALRKEVIKTPALPTPQRKARAGSPSRHRLGRGPRTRGPQPTVHAL